jgi:putative transcriptional regulator
MKQAGIRGSQGSYMSGQLLMAMPTMQDNRFARTVIYMCAHNKEGAMGLVINRLAGAVTFPDLLQQLGIDSPKGGPETRIHFGGPVETGRGFVLHSGEYRHESTLDVDDEVALTATVDILQDIAKGCGPRRSLLALGYAGWGPGQLDTEIHANGWLHVAPDEELVFDADLDSKWDRAIAKLGFDPTLLSGHAGHA